MYFVKIACIGGGPGGLYFIISMKLRNPEHEITVMEQNMPHYTFGWGIVFSDQILENILLNAPVVQKQSAVVLPIGMTSMFTSIMFYITTKCINMVN